MPSFNAELYWGGGANMKRRIFCLGFDGGESILKETLFSLKVSENRCDLSALHEVVLNERKISWLPPSF